MNNMLNIASVMEALMVVCFGASWPINVSKAWKAKSTKGISLLFYVLIWVGYIFALIGKFITIHYQINVAGTATSWTQVVKWYVMFFYVLNLLMVSAGILVYFRNKKLEKEAK